MKQFQEMTVDEVFEALKSICTPQIGVEEIKKYIRNVLGFTGEVDISIAASTNPSVTVFKIKFAGLSTKTITI